MMVDSVGSTFAVFKSNVSCLLVLYVLLCFFFFGIKFNAEVMFHSFFFLVS